MIQLQEAKKKAYSINTGSNFIQDPIKYVSRLSASRKAITEIKISKDSPAMAEDGLLVIKNFFMNTDDESLEIEQHNLVPSGTNAIPVTQSQYIIPNYEIEQTTKRITAGKFGKNRVQFKDGNADEKSGGTLGKRSILAKQLEERDQQPAKYKYCDPLTGAYYNSVEEFRRIRQLWAVDQRKQLEKSMHYLGVLNSTKNKRLTYLLTCNE